MLNEKDFFSKYPDITEYQIIPRLDAWSLGSFSQVNRLFYSLSQRTLRKELYKKEAPLKLQRCMHILSDYFPEEWMLLFSSPDKREKMTQVLSVKYHDIKYRCLNVKMYLDEKPTDYSSLIDMEIKNFDVDIGKQNPPPKEGHQKEPKKEPSQEAKEKDIITWITRAIDSNLRMRVYEKKGQYLNAICKALEICFYSRNFSTFYSIVYYLQFLNNNDYRKAAQFFCLKFKSYLMPLHINQFINDQNSLPMFLIQNALHSKNDNFIPGGILGTEELAQLRSKFLALSKKINLHYCIYNLLHNFPILLKTYGKTILEKFDEVMPFVIYIENIQTLVDVFSIEEIVKFDYRLVKIVLPSIKQEELKDCLQYIQDNYDEKLKDKLLKVPYAELIFKFFTYHELYIQGPSENNQGLMDYLFVILTNVFNAYDYPSKSLEEKREGCFQPLCEFLDLDQCEKGFQYANYLLGFIKNIIDPNSLEPILRQLKEKKYDQQLTGFSIYNQSVSDYLIKDVCNNKFLEEIFECDDLFKCISGQSFEEAKIKPGLIAIFDKFLNRNAFTHDEKDIFLTKLENCKMSRLVHFLKSQFKKTINMKSLLETIQIGFLSFFGNKIFLKMTTYISPEDIIKISQCKYNEKSYLDTCKTLNKELLSVIIDSAVVSDCINLNEFEKILCNPVIPYLNTLSNDQIWYMFNLLYDEQLFFSENKTKAAYFDFLDGLNKKNIESEKCSLLFYLNNLGLNFKAMDNLYRHAYSCYLFMDINNFNKFYNADFINFSKNKTFKVLLENFWVGNLIGICQRPFKHDSFPGITQNWEFLCAYVEKLGIEDMLKVARNDDSYFRKNAISNLIKRYTTGELPSYMDSESSDSDSESEDSNDKTHQFQM